MLTISFSLQNLVECTGIEPVVPEGGGVTDRCITIDASTPLFVFTTPSVSLRMTIGT
jgi:hypothetical protein